MKKKQKQKKTKYGQVLGVITLLLLLNPHACRDAKATLSCQIGWEGETVPETGLVKAASSLQGCLLPPSVDDASSVEPAESFFCR